MGKRLQAMKLLVYLLRAVLGGFYSLFKILPVKDKITMISRESNSKPIDFALIEEEILRRKDNVQLVFLCKTIDSGLFAKLRYGFYLIQSLYHIATSKVCIVDTYCIPISILKHRAELLVVQLWHSLGAIKKFGYQALDTFEGHSSTVAKNLNMHQNYSYVTCASEATRKFYSEAFRVPESRIRVDGMPRIDYIIGDETSNRRCREKVYRQHPQLREKQNILYVPTFRKDTAVPMAPLLEHINPEKYNLIIKLHPLDSTDIAHGFAVLTKVRTFDLLKVSDYVITDYSAASIEASLLDKPVLFYLYDVADYQKKRGLNVDLFQEMPGCTFTEFEELMAVIESGRYPYEALRAFRDKYVETADTNNTRRIVNHIYSTVGWSVLETEDPAQMQTYRDELC